MITQKDIGGSLTGNYSFRADVNIHQPESGFSFSIGLTGTPFTGYISFSGYSGYVFDQEEDLVGGYKSGENITISGHVFDSRLSYFINNVLIKNNVSISSETGNTIYFDNGGSGTLNVDINKING